MSFEPEDIAKLENMMEDPDISKTIDAQRELMNELFNSGKITEQEWDKMWVDSQEVVSLLRIAYRRIIGISAEVIRMEEERKVFENLSLLDFVPDVLQAIETRMIKDDARWGNEWLKRPIYENEDWESQDVRIFARFDKYFKDAEEDQRPMTEEEWLKVIGNALIAIVRLRNPQLFPGGDVHPEWKEYFVED